MIVGLVAVLEQLVVWPWLFYAFAITLVLSVGWAHLRLRMRIAELRVDGADLQIVSVRDATRGERSGPWERVFEVRADRGRISIAAAQRLYELDAADWPDAARLVDVLRRARIHPHDLPPE